MYSLTPPFYAASGGEYNPQGFTIFRKSFTIFVRNGALKNKIVYRAVSSCKTYKFFEIKKEVIYKKENI
jgi:hypothetical protein